MQAHLHTVFRSVDTRHTVFMQFFDFGRYDHATTTTKHLDIPAAVGLEQIHHVLEEFDVTALVGGNGDALHIFLQSGIDNLLHRAVMAKVNHLGAGRLHDPPHDIDRGIMAVKQRRRSNEAQLVLRLVGQEFLRNGKIGHGGCLFCYGLGVTILKPFQLICIVPLDDNHANSAKMIC